MQFTKPIPFDEAVEKLGERSAIGATLKSSEWADVPVAMRERAFFSSTVESTRFLQRARNSINDFLNATREDVVGPDGVTRSALKTGGRQQFVQQLQAFALAEGMGPLDPKHKGTIRDITSQRRLELIFDTQVRQANDFGAWKQGQDPDILAEFPAQRFIRTRSVKEPRNNHTIHEDQARLKSDVGFWTAINRDFGVPWGPWGWGCGHDVEDVDRDEAEDLGLIAPGENPASAEAAFNDELKASTRGLDPDLLEKLRNALGDRVEISGDEIRWRTDRPAAPAPTAEATDDAAPVRQAPVSQAVDFSKTDLAAREVSQMKDALALIDKVHDDGQLPQIPARKHTRGKKLELGGYAYTRGDHRAHSISLKRNPIARQVTIHETGHFLDHQVLFQRSKFASENSPDFAKWRAAVDESAAIKAMRETVNTTASFETLRHYNYMLQYRESWARAYSQWITQKTNHVGLKSELRDMEVFMGKDSFWTAEDFAPIATEMDAIFRAKGWME